KCVAKDGHRLGACEFLLSNERGRQATQPGSLEALDIRVDASRRLWRTEARLERGSVEVELLGVGQVVVVSQFTFEQQVRHWFPLALRFSAHRRVRRTARHHVMFDWLVKAPERYPITI